MLAFEEALKNMRTFNGNRGVDILKDAMSLPGILLQYLLRETSRCPNPLALYTQEKEAYDMLKASITGGLSIVFTHYHEVE